MMVPVFGSSPNVRTTFGHMTSSHHRTDDGRAFRTLNILDEFSRECLAIRVKRKLNSTDVVDTLTDLFILRGVPSFIRSDNGPEFIAEIVRNWIAAVGAKNRIHRTRFTLGKRLLRKLQCQTAGRTSKRRSLLHFERSTNHNRAMEETLQHQETT